MPDQERSGSVSLTLTLENIVSVAKDLWLHAADIPVWAFYGEMGSGKTTLIKTICEELGVTSVMTSPTFSIVNQYEGHNGLIIYHFDCYRLRREEEAYDIGMEEYLDSGFPCFIEWPERILSLLPSRYVKIEISIEGPAVRRIHCTRYE